MSEPRDQKLEMKNIPGMRSRERFVEVEHAQNVGDTLKRIIAYFIHEKILVFCMLTAVIFGTLCGVYAPSLQSNAIDIIAGTGSGKLISTLLCMGEVWDRELSPVREKNVHNQKYLL